MRAANFQLDAIKVVSAITTRSISRLQSCEDFSLSVLIRRKILLLSLHHCLIGVYGTYVGRRYERVGREVTKIYFFQYLR